MSNRPPSKARSKTKPKTRHSAEIVDVKVVEALRGAALVKRALGGHVPSIIEWLSKHGGPEWRLE